MTQETDHRVLASRAKAKGRLARRSIIDKPLERLRKASKPKRVGVMRKLLSGLAGGLLGGLSAVLMVALVFAVVGCGGFPTLQRIDASGTGTITSHWEDADGGVWVQETRVQEVGLDVSSDDPAACTLVEVRMNGGLLGSGAIEATSSASCFETYGGPYRPFRAGAAATDWAH
jgi:hypothetical protein